MTETKHCYSFTTEGIAEMDFEDINSVMSTVMGLNDNKEQSESTARS